MIIDQIERLDVKTVERLKESPNSLHKDGILSLTFGEIFESIQVPAREPDHYLDWKSLLLAKALVFTHGRQPDPYNLTIIGDVTTTLEKTTPLRKLEQGRDIVDQIVEIFTPCSTKDLATITEDAGIFMSLRETMLTAAIRTTFSLPSNLLKDTSFIEELVATTPHGANPSIIPGGIDGIHTISLIADKNLLGELKVANLFQVAPEVWQSLSHELTNQYLNFFTKEGRVTEPMLKHLGSETVVALLLSAYNFHPTLILRMLETLVEHDESSNKPMMLPANLIGFQD